MKFCLLFVGSALSVSLLDDPKADPQFKDGLQYSRHIPAQFSPGTLYEHMYDSNRIPHDELMYKMIKNYAKEGKDPENGRPNGRFYINKDDALKVALPMIVEHTKLSGDKLAFYMQSKVEDTFRYMDVLGSGFIEAEQMGRFLKEVCQDSTLQLH